MMREERGITLATLTVYIVVFTIALTLLGSLMTYFNSNIKNIDQNSISSEEFNKFNVEFIQDIKQSTAAEIVNNTNGNVRIILSNGANYNYIAKDNAIYRDYVKIAESIVKFSAITTDDTESNNNKNIITVTIGTGTNKNKPNFGKTIRYVLRYW